MRQIQTDFRDNSEVIFPKHGEKLLRSVPWPQPRSRETLNTAAIRTPANSSWSWPESQPRKDITTAGHDSGTMSAESFC